MRMILTPQQLAQASHLTYDGYDPAWIIGTHTEGSQYDYGTLHHGHGNRNLLHRHDPHRRLESTPMPSIVEHFAPGVQSVKVVQPKPATVHVVPKPPVILYPHGIGHTLGNNHGYKNIVVLRVPICCDGCEKKWKDKLTFLPGFVGVNVDKRHSSRDMKVTVFGHMDTHSVVKTIQKFQPRVEFWK